MAATIERYESPYGTAHRLLVNGAPFIVLGAQAHNSSAWPARLPSLWRQMHALGVNTVELPIYWEQLEPRTGEFDFSCVDAVVEGARDEGFKLILLWFGTWKNGTCDYTPGWIKEEPGQYPLMRARSGEPVRALSPHFDASCAADQWAFAALMRRLRELDADTGTVIMVQVENEPGSLFTDRDYSEHAQELYAQGIAPDLVDALGLSADTWEDAFPGAPGEAFNAFATARYVNRVAEAGAAEFEVPLSVNVWLKERKGFMRPGAEYPSGVPVSHLIDLWKAAAPAIDLIAPDIYVMDYAGYREVCEHYRRSDNALFIPETGGTAPFARYLFYALGDYGAIGWAPFGVDRPDGELHESLSAVRDSFHLLRGSLPEIARLQQRGTLRAAVEEQYLANRLLDFERYRALVEFGRLNFGYGGLAATGTREQSGRVLVGERGPNEFLVTGFDARVTFAPRQDPLGSVQFLTVDEGRFVDDVWVSERRLNGDQTFFGLRLPPEGATYLARLQPLDPG